MFSFYFQTGSHASSATFSLFSEISQRFQYNLAITANLCRKSHAPAEKLSRALDAVIEYNQNQERPDDRWRINTSVLQQLTGCFNASVKDFVALHQETIDQHNHTFGLTSVRHNSAHKGQDPNSFITW
jgi:hypothetical protein